MKKSQNLKRFICILLVLVMVFGTFGTVYAAETEGIEITEIRGEFEEPKVGAVPDTSMDISTVPAEAATVSSVSLSWEESFDGSSWVPMESETFEGGKYYRPMPDISLSNPPIKEGYTVSYFSVKLYLNGKSIAITSVTSLRYGPLPLPVDGVNIHQDTLTIRAGQSSQLSVTITPERATNKAHFFSSSDPSIATVDADGVVTGISEGNVDITVKTIDGGFTDTCAVTVEKKLEINNANISITVPKRTEQPGTAYSLSTEFSVSETSWNPAHSSFMPETVYTVTVKLVPAAGYQFVSGTSFKINGIDAKVISCKENEAEISFTFPKTEAAPVNKHSVSVKSEGEGTASASLTSASQGTEISLTAVPKNGYYLKEWQVVKGNVTISNGKFIMPDTDVEIKAVFKKADAPLYTVTVNGSYSSSSGEGSYKAGEKVTIYSGERDGYKFTGWTSSNVSINNSADKTANFTMPAQNVTVTATWTSLDEEVFYKLTFNTNGGSTIKSLSLIDGSKVFLSGYKPTRDGYTFTGWYSDTALTQRITSVVISRDTTIYAGWKSTSVKVNPFKDVKADDYYYDAVLWAVEKGITVGTSETEFSPKMVCTRAQVMTFLWRAAGSPAPKSDKMPFTDVKKDDYYYDAVLWAVEKGITVGTSETEFSPDQKCSRAHIITFLWRSQSKPAVNAANPYTDVKADDYYYDAVRWAYTKNMTVGTNGTSFLPNQDCDRAQTVTFLYQCFKK